MKIVAVSDLHNIRPSLPDGDILVIAGDATMSGTHSEITEFGRWLHKINHKFEYVLFTPGNHDFYFERWQKESIVIDENIFFVINDTVRINGINFWLSPYSNQFGAWAFMKREENLTKIWSQIPGDTDVIVTHGPPKNVQDFTIGNVNVGSRSLLEKALEIKPKYHIFGHIHEAYGQSTILGNKDKKYLLCQCFYN